MAFYFAFIFSIALMSSLAAALHFCISFRSDPPSNKDYSIYIATCVVESAITVFFTFLHFMMLALYYKFSKLKHGKTAMTLDRVAKHMKVSNLSES